MADNAPTLPMPGEHYDGKIVVASCWENEDGTGGVHSNLVLAGLLLLDPHPNRAEPHGHLDPEQSFYSVVQIVAVAGDDAWGETIVLADGPDVRNIVDATAAYLDQTGCV